MAQQLLTIADCGISNQSANLVFDPTQAAGVPPKNFSP
jgi:hypothetical protein